METPSGENSLDLATQTKYQCVLQGQSVELDFEKPVQELIILCIAETQERLKIVEKKKKVDEEARKAKDPIFKRPGIAKEIQLCLNMAKYLLAYQQKNKAPGIQYSLEKIASILEDDYRLLKESTNQSKEMAQKIIHEMRSSPLIQRFLVDHGLTE